MTVLSLEIASRKQACWSANGIAEICTFFAVFTTEIKHPPAAWGT
jgi:hypothetical protein